MYRRLFSLLILFVLTFSLLAACGGGNEDKEASVPTLDVTFDEFVKKWTDDLEKAEGEGGVSSVVTEQIDISNLTLEGQTFKKELMKGFTLQGEVAENDKLTKVSITADNNTNEEPPEDMEKVLEMLQGAFMSYGLLIKSVNPDLKEEDQPLVKLGFINEKGELLTDEQASQEKSVVIKNVKYTKMVNGVSAEPAEGNEAGTGT